MQVHMYLGRYTNTTRYLVGGRVAGRKRGGKERGGDTGVTNCLLYYLVNKDLLT